jgi:thiosulfate/3-mercaptopyruvate sulfurtransferase
MPFATLIDTSTLSDRLSDSSLAIVDCRSDLVDEGWGLRAYAAQHVPGAVYADLMLDLSGALNGQNGRHPLPEPATLSQTLGRLGIDRSVQVVAYDQATGAFASRLWWLLRWMGHDAVAVLDGGFAKWEAEHRPVRAGVETRVPKAFVGEPRAGWVVTADEVSRAHAAGSVLVDARAPERYRGEIEPIDKVAGHIPGAINHFFEWNLAADKTFLPADQIRAGVKASLGDTRPADMIGYCGSGVTACQNLLAFEHAGLSGSRLYAGSWSEWSSDPSRPIERS